MNAFDLSTWVTGECEVRDHSQLYETLSQKTHSNKKNNENNSKKDRTEKVWQENMTHL